MAVQIQILRGTTAENDSFTGALGALTYDTDKKQLRVHDGATPGGASVIDSVIELQAPTASNNHTWYRKYTSGWVEQGGRATTSASGVSTITLPVAMLDTNYCTYITASQLANVFIFCRPDSTTQVAVRALSGTGADIEQPKAVAVSWRVSGMAAN